MERKMNGRMKANWLSPCRECDATVRLYSRPYYWIGQIMAPIHTRLVWSGAAQVTGMAVPFALGLPE